MRIGRSHMCALLLVLKAAPVSAHPLAPSLLDLRELDRGRVGVVWKTPRMRVPGTDTKPALPAHCRDVTAPSIASDDMSVRTSWTADCGSKGLVGSTVAIDNLTGSDTVVVRVRLNDGRTVQNLLTPRAASFVVPAQTDAWSVAGAYVAFGVRHIFTGADHLLFVFGLLLLADTRRRLIATITAFTVGHSLTLALVVLAVFTPPQGPTEVAIALSVLALAVELARTPTPRSTLRRRPWLMSFGFGLLHGLGFASAMQSAGLTHAELPLALASFNVGIEAGQLTFVTGVLAIRRVLAFWQPVAPAWVMRIPVYAMGSLAVWWTLQRVAAL